MYKLFLTMSDIYNFFFGGEHRHKHHHHHKHPIAHPTYLVISHLKYHSLKLKISNIMSLSLNVGEFVTSTLGLVDHTTGAAVEATFANSAFTSDDSTIATVGADGKVSGVAAGTTNLTFKTDASYTNSLGVAVTETKSLIVSATITAIVTANGTDLVVTFSAPATA